MSTCKTRHACDNIWNLGAANTICFSGYLNLSVRVGSTACQQLYYLPLNYLFIPFSFLWVWPHGIRLTSKFANSWAMLAALLSVGNFQDGVLWTIFLDFPPTMIILHSASSVAKIIFLTHQCHTTLVFDTRSCYVAQGITKTIGRSGTWN
jgi:hypothetical protein